MSIGLYVDLSPAEASAVLFTEVDQGRTVRLRTRVDGQEIGRISARPGNLKGLALGDVGRGVDGEALGESRGGEYEREEGSLHCEEEEEEWG